MSTKQKSKNLGRGLSALLPDAGNEPEPNGLLNVKVDDVKPNPLQPRHDFDKDALLELSESIREKGVIQPLVVRRSNHGFELIAGERRLRAAKMAGVLEVPARILDVDNDTEMLELSLIENLQRNDLNPVELAEGYQNLQKKYGLTQELIAQRVGKDRATIANSIRILELPPPILQSLRNGEITMGHAKCILSLEGAARQSALWKRVLEAGLSVRQTEQLARSINAERRNSNNGAHQELNPLLMDYTDRIRRALGTQVKIARKGRKGTIRVEFYSDDELERLVELLANAKGKW